MILRWLLLGLLVGLLLAGPAWAQPDYTVPNPLNRAAPGQPDALGLPLGDEGPPEPEPLPPPAQPTPGQLAAWEADLVGKPVMGRGGGTIGTVEALILDADRNITGVLVRLDINNALLPVTWNWVGRQLGRRTIVLPWSPEDVAWLTGRD